MSQTNNKSAYGVFSSIKAEGERRIEGMESELQTTILISMTTCGLTSGSMDGKGYTKKLVGSM